MTGIMASEFRPIIIQLNKTAGCGGPLPARRFPGVRGGAAYIFWGHMVSNGIQLFFPQLVALDYGYIRLVA